VFAKWAKTLAAGPGESFDNAVEGSSVVRRWTGIPSPFEENSLLPCGSNVSSVETTRQRRKHYGNDGSACTEGKRGCRREEASAYYKTFVESDRFQVNGFEMYYEVHGSGKGTPLVKIPPFLSLVNVFPALIAGRQLIAVEPRGYGRSSDVDRH
jgi:hypothetical protein